MNNADIFRKLKLIEKHLIEIPKQKDRNDLESLLMDMQYALNDALEIVRDIVMED